MLFYAFRELKIEYAISQLIFLYSISENQKLSEEQTRWVSDATDRVYRLLEDTPPEGSTFAKTIRHILKV